MYVERAAESGVRSAVPVALAAGAVTGPTPSSEV